MPRRWSSSDLIRTPSGTLTAKSASKGRLKSLSLHSPGTSPSSLLNRKLFQGLVIGIDPSLRGTGIALVHCKNNSFTLLHSVTIKTKSLAPIALGEIASALTLLCDSHTPAAAAVEEAIFAQNHRTALTLGAARGAILATLALQNIPAHSFAPTRIKQAIVGHGRASKPQIAAMTRRLLKLKADLPFDEADAAAAALCFILTYRG